MPYLTFLMIGGLILAGCGGSQDAVSPETILANSVNHMAALPGFEFQITQEGPPVYLDVEESVAFSSAQGHYVAPDQAQTTVTISIGSLLAEITVISLQDVQWASNPLSGQFQELPPEYLFKPIQYLDPETGFFPSLRDGLTDLVLVGEEELDDLPGLKLTHLSGNLPGEVIQEVSKGLINIESMTGDLWVDPATNEVHRVVLTDSSGEDSSSVWTFDFWNFGTVIEITAP